MAPKGKSAKNRTIGKVYLTRLQDEEGELGDPTEIILLRRDEGPDGPEWVFARPAIPGDDETCVQQVATSLGRTQGIVVECTQRLYSRTDAPASWEEFSIASFSFREGEFFPLATVANLPVLSEELEGVDAMPVAPGRGVIEHDLTAADTPERAPPAAAARPVLGAAPIYAAGLAQPLAWRGRPDVAAGRGVGLDLPSAAAQEAPRFSGGPPCTAADWAIVMPEIIAAVHAALAPQFAASVPGQLLGSVGELSERMARLEVPGPVAAPAQLPPGQYFDPPSRGAPLPPADALPAAPVVRGAQAASTLRTTPGLDAVAEARALLGSVPARASTSQMLRLSSDPARPASAVGADRLDLGMLLQLLSNRADIGTLLESDGVLGGVAAASGARGLAALERARVSFESNPRELWRYVMSQVTRVTRVRGGGLLAYFEGSAVQHHELALFLLHLVDRISTAALEEDGDMVLGLCGSAITFLDQAARDQFSLRLATELSLLRDPELPYLGPETDATKRARAAYGKPFSPLVNPSTYAAVTAAFKDIETLTAAARPAKGKGKGA